MAPATSVGTTEDGRFPTISKLPRSSITCCATCHQRKIMRTPDPTGSHRIPLHPTRSPHHPPTRPTRGPASTATGWTCTCTCCHRMDMHMHMLPPDGRAHAHAATGWTCTCTCCHQMDVHMHMLPPDPNAPAAQLSRWCFRSSARAASAALLATCHVMTAAP
jgi:hypothetical protein